MSSREWQSLYSLKVVNLIQYMYHLILILHNQACYLKTSSSFIFILLASYDINSALLSSSLAFLVHFLLYLLFDLCLLISPLHPQLSFLSSFCQVRTWLGFTFLLQNIFVLPTALSASDSIIQVILKFPFFINSHTLVEKVYVAQETDISQKAQHRTVVKNFEATIKHTH